MLVSYIACARKLLAAPEAVYPQFATHNAHTLAAIHEMANPAAYQPDQYEFQCLHGMGEPLYERVVRPVSKGGLGRPCRVYAPVGTHETLLAYLVRRLLENGANTSFVNRIADGSIALDELVRDPVDTVDAAAAAEGAAGLAHPRIAHPLALYGKARANSAGLDLASEVVLENLGAALQASGAQRWRAAPMLACQTGQAALQAVRNPADASDLVGEVQEAQLQDVELALSLAHTDGQTWRTTPAAERSQVLLRAADLMQADMPALIALLVREAIDFLRYYALQAESTLASPQTQALGTVVCISPWNFPLAIFTGQVCAALAAGNCVLAKPAEQTPLIAAQAVRLLWQAGVPRAALQMLPGRGETVGAALVADARAMGVVFTGSTQVARAIQHTLAGRLDAAGRPVTLIAETGGQNAMVVDSSALAEQAVVDILASAFDSAGQRCSALRVLCIQEDAAPHLLPMLRGAMGELQLGNPALLATDVGPVIDAKAQAGIVAHIDAMRARGCAVFQSHDAVPAGTGTPL